MFNNDIGFFLGCPCRIRVCSRQIILLLVFWASRCPRVRRRFCLGVDRVSVRRAFKATLLFLSVLIFSVVYLPMPVVIMVVKGTPVRRSLLVTVSTCVIAWAICFSNVEALALQWFFERYTFSFNGESVYAVLLSLPTRLKIRVSTTRFSKIESL